jgi:hypothetical protein
MLENVCDVLISQRIIEGDGGDAEEEAGPVSNAPLFSVLGKDADQLELGLAFLGLGSAVELAVDDATAEQMGFREGFLIGQVFNFLLIFLSDNRAWVISSLPSAGLLPCSLAELRMMAFIVSSPGEGMA